MLDLPGVLELAADHDMPELLEAFVLVVSGDLRPAHGRRILEQDVCSLLVRRDRIDLRSRKAAPTHRVQAETCHQRRLGLTLARFEPGGPEAPASVGVDPAHERAGAEGLVRD
jgi:hypothetical protein